MEDITGAGARPKPKRVISDDSDDEQDTNAIPESPTKKRKQLPTLASSSDDDKPLGRKTTAAPAATTGSRKKSGHIASESDDNVVLHPKGKTKKTKSHTGSLRQISGEFDASLHVSLPVPPLTDCVRRIISGCSDMSVSQFPSHKGC
jgi:hypothetical protein